MAEREILFHLVEGEGEPLLLLNGVAMTAASWAPVAARLEATVRVIRCDLRGQLMSPGAPPADPARHVDDVVALLDELGVEQSHILATSFGGAVAIALAATRPERVASLVLVATTDAFDAEMATEVARWRAACLQALAGGERGRLIEVLDRTVYSRPYLEQHAAERSDRRRQVALLPDAWFEGLAGLLESAGRFSLAPLLGTIRCPTLLVAGGEDAFIPRARMEGLARTIADARLLVVEGAGHAVVVERPDEIARLTLAHLARLEG